MNTCLITGCRLILPAEGKSLWGDLHRYDGAYVFNGVLKDFGAAWDYNPEVAIFPEHQVILRENAPYFERRAVVVFNVLHGQLNARAQEYLRKWNP